jgi:Arc/MetJ-type ribon-helix-helix transcriptional regulator
MVTDMITLKLERNFLRDIDATVKKQNYQNRTEFIRNALRDKIEQAKTRDAINEIIKLKGKSNKKTSEKELEKLREKALRELEKKL